MDKTLSFFYVNLEKGFQTYSVDQWCSESLHIGLTWKAVSYLIQWVWGGAQQFALLTSPQVLVMLLALGPYSDTSNVNKQKSKGGQLIQLAKLF